MREAQHPDWMAATIQLERHELKVFTGEVRMA
jgi:hypothetical protein